MAEDHTERLESEVPRIDIRSRIAAFSGQPASQPSAKSIVQQPNSKGLIGHVGRLDHTLRKAPSTSSLLHVRQDPVTTSIEGNAQKTSLGTFTLPTRTRTNTSGGDGAAERNSTPDSSHDSPRLDVKSIVALYGPKVMERGHSTNAGEEGLSQRSDQEVDAQPERPPTIPKRPSVASVPAKDTPSIPSSRPNAAPILPPRIPRRTSVSSGVLRNDTGSSSNSGHDSLTRHSNGNTNATSGLSYVPRKSTGQHATGSPSLPARPYAARSSDDLGLPSRPHNNSSSSTGSFTPQARSIGMGQKWASTSSGNLNANKTDMVSTTLHNSLRTATPPLPPPPPPRHRTTGSVSSATAAAVNVDDPVATAANASLSTSLLPPKRTAVVNGSPTTSQPASPRSAPHTPSVAQRTTASTGQLAMARSVASTTPVSGTEALAPPPRHIDARRSRQASGGRGTPVRLEMGRARRQARRTRRRDERAQMVFEGDPRDAVVAQRYASVFEKHASKANNSSDWLIDRQQVVRIWRRSKLDSWYLRQVWQTALIRSSSTENSATPPALRRDAFVRAMCAIDGELARRTGRSVGTVV